MSIEQRYQNKRRKSVDKSHKRKEKCNGKVRKDRKTDITKKKKKIKPSG